MPELVSSDDEEVGEERMTTRAQVALRTKEEKRKPADVIDSDATTVQLAEGLMNSRAKKPRTHQVDTMDEEERKQEDNGGVQAIESQLLHDQKLSACHCMGMGDGNGGTASRRCAGGGMGKSWRR